MQVEQRAVETSMALTIIESLNASESDGENVIKNVIESTFDIASLKVRIQL